MARSGADLALLLLAGFRTLADRATVELAARGYPDVRPVHEFAMQAILGGADNVSELGRRLSVSKQAAAKTVAVLEDRRYVSREPDATDKRRMRLAVTDHGHAMLREGEAIFEDLRAEWERLVGAQQVVQIEDALRQLIGDSVARLDAPESMARDLAP